MAFIFALTAAGLNQPATPVPQPCWRAVAKTVASGLNLCHPASASPSFDCLVSLLDSESGDIARGMELAAQQGFENGVHDHRTRRA